MSGGFLMRQMTWIVLPIILISCAHKGVEPPSPAVQLEKKTPFFMTKPAPASEVVLVVDREFAGPKLVNYRKRSDLKISGSGTFGPMALKDLAKPLKKKKMPLYVFDLRQESHGLVNDQPITWHADRNWSNTDLNHDEAIRRERRLLGDLQIGSLLDGKEIKSIETEESMVRTSGHQYVRLTVIDHVRPSDSEVDRFIEAVKTLPVNAWVHFHCRDGGNRTSTFMHLYEELVGKKELDSVQDPELFQLGDAQEWNYSYKKERLEFLQEFSKYAKAHPRGEGMLWSEWVQK